MNVPAMQRLLGELRSQGIVDENVLAAVGAIDRERFVLPTFVERAWENTALPIAFGQTISQPLVVATMHTAAGDQPDVIVILQPAAGTLPDDSDKLRALLVAERAAHGSGTTTKIVRSSRSTI